LAYYEICNIKWVKHMCMSSSDAMAPYGTDGRDWVGYDDIESIVYKVKNVVLGKKLRGFMFWALDLDDFRGTCNGGKGEKYPLIRAAKLTAQGKRVRQPQCMDFVAKECIEPTDPPTVVPKTGKNGCRLHTSGPWGISTGQRRIDLDRWCKSPENCPSYRGCDGCAKCMCICDGEKTTDEPSTTTEIIKTKQPTKRPTRKPKVTSNVLENGCRLNNNSPWGRAAVDLKRQVLNDWCKNPENCPNEHGDCEGCANCMCICDGKKITKEITKPIKTTTEPITTTTEPITTTTEPITTTTEEIKKTTKKPKVRGCRPRSGFAKYGYGTWCNTYCKYCNNPAHSYVRTYCICP